MLENSNLEVLELMLRIPDFKVLEMILMILLVLQSQGVCFEIDTKNSLKVASYCRIIVSCQNPIPHVLAFA